MNHKERIDAVLAGEPVDRLPTSVWGHDFLREWSAADLAAQTIETQRKHDYDFVKINPRWTLFAEPWGNVYEPPVEQKFPRLLQRIVESVGDVAEVPHVAAEHPVLAEHVEAVRLVTDEIGDDVYCLATLFSPLAALGLLCGGVGQPLLRFMEENPESCHVALDHITATLTEHARQLIDAGAAGLFYAPLQWTSLDVCNADTYAEFGEPYDRRLLAAVGDASFNMLHVCGDNIDMARFHDYPVQVLNWDNFGNGNPSLEEVASESGKVVAGGIPHRKLHKLEEDELLDLSRRAVGDRHTGVMLAGGCGIGALTPAGARAAVVKVAERL